MPLLPNLASRALTTAAFATVAGLAAPAHAQTVLTLSSWVPPAHTLTTTQIEWCNLLEQKVPGKIKCNVLPRAVSAPPGTFDAVRNGLVDLSFTRAKHRLNNVAIIGAQHAALVGNVNVGDALANAIHQARCEVAPQPVIAFATDTADVIETFVHLGQQVADFFRRVL